MWSHPILSTLGTVMASLGHLVPTKPGWCMLSEIVVFCWIQCTMVWSLWAQIDKGAECWYIDHNQVPCMTGCCDKMQLYRCGSDCYPVILGEEPDWVGEWQLFMWGAWSIARHARPSHGMAGSRRMCFHIRSSPSHPLFCTLHQCNLPG